LEYEAFKLEPYTVDPNEWLMSPSPTISMEDALSGAVLERFKAHLRPLVEEKKGIYSSAVAYLWSGKGQATYAG
jgi:hypothetical protein